MGLAPSRSLYIKIPALAILVLILGGMLPLAAAYVLLHRNADREVMDNAGVLLLAAQPARTVGPIPPSNGEPRCAYPPRAPIHTTPTKIDDPPAKNPHS